MDAYQNIKDKYPWLNLLPISNTHYSLDTFSVFKYCYPQHNSPICNYYNHEKMQMEVHYPTEQGTVTAKDLLSAIQDMRELLAQQDKELYELRIKAQFPALCQLGYPPSPPAQTKPSPIQPLPVPTLKAPPPDRKTICLDFD